MVKSAHLRAHAKHGLNVVGVYDISPEATLGIQEQSGDEHVFGSLKDLHADQDIEMADIARHPEQRVSLMRSALEAGKHVLAQKPLALTVR